MHFIISVEIFFVIHGLFFWALCYIVMKNAEEIQILFTHLIFKDSVLANRNVSALNWIEDL